MHVGISHVLLERADLAGARRHLEAARDPRNENGFRQYPHRSLVVEAGIRQADGDPVQAVQLLDEAEAAYVGEFSPDVRPIAALRARVWIAEGQLSRAWAWARDRDLSPGDPLSYPREFEHATLARLLLAQAISEGSATTLREAVELADRLVAGAEEGGRTGGAVDALVVLALARHADGDRANSIRALERAATLAEPEGHVRVFLAEGPAMTALLKAAARQAHPSSHLRRLHARARESRAGTPSAQPLIEPLSDRELDVLRLLGTDLDGPAIARELVLSLSTVRTHTKNIYAKLGVNNRRAAVRRARDLGVLSEARR
jgi:LuxR family maltose regulon positive regulatory protein